MKPFIEPGAQEPDHRMRASAGRLALADAAPRRAYPGCLTMRR